MSVHNKKPKVQEDDDLTDHDDSGDEQATSTGVYLNPEILEDTKKQLWETEADSLLFIRETIDKEYHEIVNRYFAFFPRYAPPPQTPEVVNMLTSSVFLLMYGLAYVNCALNMKLVADVYPRETYPEAFLVFLVGYLFEKQAAGVLVHDLVKEHDHLYPSLRDREGKLYVLRAY